MLRPFVFLVLLSASMTAASGAAQPSQPATRDAFVVSAPPLLAAPADEYFGAYQLSNLSVRTAIRDMTIEGTSPLALPLQRERIAAVQSALADWAAKYPNDPWLPSTIVRFVTLLRSKEQADYDLAAYGFLVTLEAQYPQTWYARYAAWQLANFELRPQFDLTDGPDVRQFPFVFSSMFARLRKKK